MKKISSAAILIALIAVLIIPQTGCLGKTDPVSKDSFYFDTTCKITIYNMKNMSEDNANAVIDKAFKQCVMYENLLSKTKKISDVYKINHAGGKQVKCNKITVDCIKDGLKYGKISGGRFDITIGKVDSLWNFETDAPKLPSKSAIKSALKYVDYKQVHISGDNVTMGTTEGEIDLGGIAKGYIADQISRYLKSLGVTSAVVNFGGNIECVGDKNGKDFSIGIEKPYSDQSEIVGSTNVSNGTVVTSGIYERYFTYKGKKYHHILNVDTGYPVSTDVVGVSIKSGYGHSVDCDGLSTTCLILGEKKGKALIESMKGYEALFILKNGETVKTSGFDFIEE